MSFSSAKGMARRLASIDEYDALILDLTDVPVVDFTTCRALEDIIHDAQDVGRQAFLVGARPQVNAMLIKQGIMRQLANGHLCADREEAFSKAAQILGIAAVNSGQ
jgi:SulP family sulfate permease